MCWRNAYYIAEILSVKVDVLPISPNYLAKSNYVHVSVSQVNNLTTFIKGPHSLCMNWTMNSYRFWRIHLWFAQHWLPRFSSQLLVTQYPNPSPQYEHTYALNKEPSLLCWRNAYYIAEIMSVKVDILPISPYHLAEGNYLYVSVSQVNNLTTFIKGPHSLCMNWSMNSYRFWRIHLWFAQHWLPRFTSQLLVTQYPNPSPQYEHTYALNKEPCLLRWCNAYYIAEIMGVKVDILPISPNHLAEGNYLDVSISQVNNLTTFIKGPHSLCMNWTMNSYRFWRIHLWFAQHWLPRFTSQLLLKQYPNPSPQYEHMY